MNASQQDAKLALLARMLQDQRADELEPLEFYLDRLEGEDAWVAHHYLRLVGEEGAQGLLPAEPSEGAVLGAYRLESELGRGGQGAVWRAVDERLERQVALKVLPNPPGSQDAGPRFRREAQLAASLEHPGLCTVYESGSNEHVSWIAMQLVEGRTLAQAKEVAPFEATLERFQELAAALALVHQAGIVHRDVKPSNIMLTPQGRCVLLDFGVARGDDEGLPLTRTGQAVGTPAYMSPEQLRGSGPVDARCDLWALGVALYECLCGRRPFDAPTREGTVRQILDSDPIPMGGGLPRDLEVLVSVALAKDPERRYSGAQELADELGRVRRGEPILARPMRIHERIGRWARREPRFAGSVLVLTAALVATLVGLVLALDRTRTALTERNGLLEEVARTSEQMLVDDLLSQEPGLWPALPSRLDDLEVWVQQAESAIGRAEEHRTRVDRVASRIAAAERTSGGKQTEDYLRDTWLLTQLKGLLQGIEELREPLGSVRRRAEFASNIKDLSVTRHLDAWNAVAERVAADPRFQGLELRPQVGLVPLGPDPKSGLEEFAHLASGSTPVRGEAGAGWTVAEEHGLVLVLIPGGTTQIGCLSPSEEHAEGDPYVDPEGLIYEVGLIENRFEPFLVSKYELSQAQWERHVGANPAYYNYGEEGVPPLRPVEQVSWVDCKRVLGELDLQLPTEEQWEYAARAGSTSRWFWGNDASIAGEYCNVSDSVAKARWKNPQFSYEEWLDDGYSDPAPVGSYEGNAFGIHDVLGNVQEWTSSGWSWPEEKFVNRQDPRDPETSATRTTRGGSFGETLTFARSSVRRGYAPEVASYKVGVRPIRALSE